MISFTVCEKKAFFWVGSEDLLSVQTTAIIRSYSMEAERRFDVIHPRAHVCESRCKSAGLVDAMRGISEDGHVLLLCSYGEQMRLADLIFVSLDGRKQILGASDVWISD